MAAIEVVDRIKAGPEEVVPLDDENINIVEINAEDILRDFKEETEENLQEGGEADGNLVKIKADDVKVQPSKKTDQSNAETQKNEAIDELHVVPENKLPDYLREISSEEKVLLNYSDELPRGQKHYQRFQEIQKRLPGSPFNKSIVVEQDQSVFRIGKEECTVLPDKRYQCNHCLFVNGNKKKMWIHIRHNHKERLVSPEIYKSSLEKLAKTSDCKSDVSWFEYTPEGDNDYRCNHCLIVMKGQKETEQHIIRNHRQLKLIQCPYCPYQSRHDLTSHIRSIHSDKRDYRCELCDYTSKLKNGLRRHIQNVHLGLRKKFACSECSMVFKKSKTLRDHVHCIHEGGTVQKVKCFHCSYESTVKESLVHHIQYCHTKIENLETFQCQMCPFKTKFKRFFQTHTSRCHRQMNVCHVCSYTCSQQARLKLHLLTHKEKLEEKDLRYRCNQCDYKTYRMHSLTIHKLNHKKPEEIEYFYCYHCDFKAKRKDNLKSHIFRHVKKKDIEYECYICEFKTIKMDALIRHINKHSKEATNDLIISKTDEWDISDEKKNSHMNKQSRGTKTSKIKIQKKIP